MVCQQYNIVGTPRKSECDEALDEQSMVEIELEREGSVKVLLLAKVADKPKEGKWCYMGCFADDKTAHFTMMVTFGGFDQVTCRFRPNTGTMHVRHYVMKTREMQKEVPIDYI